MPISTPMIMVTPGRRPRRRTMAPDQYIQRDEDADKDFNADTLIKPEFNADKPRRMKAGGTVKGTGCATRGTKFKGVF